MFPPHASQCPDPTTSQRRRRRLACTDESSHSSFEELHGGVVCMAPHTLLAPRSLAQVFGVVSDVLHELQKGPRTPPNSARSRRARRKVCTYQSLLATLELNALMTRPFLFGGPREAKALVAKTIMLHSVQTTLV